MRIIVGEWFCQCPKNPISWGCKQGRNRNTRLAFLYSPMYESRRRSIWMCFSERGSHKYQVESWLPGWIQRAKAKFIRNSRGACWMSWARANLQTIPTTYFNRTVTLVLSLVAEVIWRVVGGRILVDWVKECVGPGIPLTTTHWLCQARLQTTTQPIYLLIQLPMKWATRHVSNPPMTFSPVMRVWAKIHLQIWSHARQ